MTNIIIESCGCEYDQQLKHLDESNKWQLTRTYKSLCYSHQREYEDGVIVVKSEQLSTYELQGLVNNLMVDKWQIAHSMKTIHSPDRCLNEECEICHRT